MSCACCASTNLVRVIDSGEVALAGAFLSREEIARERKYPLALDHCPDCGLVQVAEPVDPDAMFGRYFYRSAASGTTKKHLEDSAAWLAREFQPRTAIEIGCNDGTLSAALFRAGVSVLAIDPAAERQAPGVTLLRDYFTRSLGAALAPADLIVANNVLAHVADLHDVVAGLGKALKPAGVLAFDLHYLPDMLDGQWDWVYHEHRYYYAALTVQRLLEAHGLALFDLERIPAHGGSVRYLACHEGARKASGRVWEVLRGELSWPVEMGLAHFAEETRTSIEAISTLVKTMQARGARVAGYGASGRASMILQRCGLKLEYVVDDTPEKLGRFMPGVHTPIVSRTRLLTDPTDALLVLSWPYLREIVAKIAGYRGQVIVPLPRVSVATLAVREQREAMCL